MVNTLEFVRSIVISTRIRLARNFAGFPFPSKMSDAHTAEVLHLAAEGLKKVDPDEEYTRCDLEKMRENDIALMQEQYLISPALLKNKRNRAAFVSFDGDVSIMVNEEDHLREQYICKGFNLYKAYERMMALDDGLAGVLDFAYDKRLGYLTACPSNLGTGMRASVMMFLPGLTWCGDIKRTIAYLHRNGMTMRGSFGEGTDAEGCLYQISNERTLGLSEKEILEQVTKFAMGVCDQELHARERMLKESETELRDRCLRAYGVLTHCALLDMEEFKTKIADVRLGLVLGFLKCKNQEQFEEFVNDMRPATFALNNNLEKESQSLHDAVRAETVCSVLPKIVQVAKGSQ